MFVCNTREKASLEKNWCQRSELPTFKTRIYLKVSKATSFHAELNKRFLHAGQLSTRRNTIRVCMSICEVILHCLQESSLLYTRFQHKAGFCSISPFNCVISMELFVEIGVLFLIPSVRTGLKHNWPLFITNCSFTKMTPLRRTRTKNVDGEKELKRMFG